MVWQRKLRGINTCRGQWILVWFVMLWGLQRDRAAGQPGDAEPPLGGQLHERGLQLPEDQWFRLPPPSLPPDTELVADMRQKRLVELAGRRGWEEFSAHSLNAPSAIKIEKINNAAGRRVAHHVHNAFIVYQPLSKLRDEDLMRTAFGQGASGEPGEQSDEGTIRALTADELETLGLPAESPEEAYAKLQITLLNKVKLAGIVRVQSRQGDGWFQVFWQLDPRFSVADAERSPENVWTKLTPNRLGQLEESEPLPYLGLGGYMIVTETGLAEDQLLFESRMVMHEPQAWFSGSNVLRAKFPLSLQETAKKLRRL